MQRGSYSFAGIKLVKLNKDKVIKQIIDGLKNLKGVLCAVLFGSIANDQYTGLSDADVLLIIEENLSPNERYRRYNRINADVDVQLFIFTLDEVMSRIDIGDTFIINMIVTGKPLLGDELYKTLMEQCRKAIKRYGLKRISIGWQRVRKDNSSRNE